MHTGHILLSIHRFFVGPRGEFCCQNSPNRVFVSFHSSFTAMSFSTAFPWNFSAKKEPASSPTPKSHTILLTLISISAVKKSSRAFERKCPRHVVREPLLHKLSSERDLRGGNYQSLSAATRLSWVRLASASGPPARQPCRPAAAPRTTAPPGGPASP